MKDNNYNHVFYFCFLCPLLMIILALLRNKRCPVGILIDKISFNNCFNFCRNNDRKKNMKTVITNDYNQFP